MDERSRWVKRTLECPEARGTCHLLVQWRREGGAEVLSGIHCSDPHLLDLSGGECDWACWETMVQEMGQEKGF